MRRPFLWLALASAVLLPQTAYAWGAEGHEIVGLIGLKHLDPRVKRQSIRCSRTIRII